MGRKRNPTLSTSETQGVGDSKNNPARSANLARSKYEKSRGHQNERDYSFTQGSGLQPAVPIGDMHHAVSDGGAHTSVVQGKPSSVENAASGMDLDLDFDSPDEADALLRLTDPASLSGGPLPVPSVEVVDTRQHRSPRERMITTLPSGLEPGRKSPSPPLSPRKGRSESKDDTQRRSRAGRGLTHWGADDDSLVETSERRGVGNSGGEMDATISRAVGEKAAPTDAAEPAMPLNRRGSSNEHPLPFSEKGDGGAKRVGREDSLLVDRPNPGEANPRAPTSNAIGRRSPSQSMLGDGSAVLAPASATEPAGGAVQRRSALAGGDKQRSIEAKSRGVTFDDDLGGVDALDILPLSSDEDEKSPVTPRAPSPESHPVPLIEDTNFRAQPAARTANVGGFGDQLSKLTDADGNGGRPSLSLSVTPTREDIKILTPMMEGLSPAAARLMTEDSSSEDTAPSASANPLRSGLTASGFSSVGRKGEVSRLGLGARTTDVGENITDDAKLELALGFTPSAMEGGRRPRRALPAGSKRRSRVGGAPGPGDDTTSVGTGGIPAPAPVAAELVMRVAVTPPEIERDAADVGKTLAAREGKGERNGAKSRQDRAPSLGAPSAGGRPVPSAGTNVPAETVVRAGANEELSKPSSASVKVSGKENTSVGGGREGSVGAVVHTRAQNDIASASQKATSIGPRRVDASMFESLERQLLLLASDKEATAVRFSKDEERLQREADMARDATAVAETKACEMDAALAAARYN